MLAVSGLHKHLVVQRDFLEVLLHRAFNHLGSDIGWLARFLGLGQRHAALFFDQVGRHVVRAQSHWFHRSHVHGHILGSLGVTFVFDHHADTGAVQVHSQVAAREALEATEGHVFTDLADQALAHVFQRGAEGVLLVSQGAQCFHIGRILFRHQLGRCVGHGDEAVILGHEVGFAVDFDHGAFVAIHESGDHAFCSNTRSSLASLGAQLDAQ
ncbi:hypothetical protein D3C72_1185110 [compost metagenome]